ncbi:MAG: glycosyltransferase family 4 protein [Chloroflexota bacterium]
MKALRVRFPHENKPPAKQRYTVKITLDASAAVHQRAGIGRYTQELLTQLLELSPQHRYAVFYNRAGDARLQAPIDRLERCVIPTGDKPWRLRVLLAHWLRRPQEHIFPAADLFHATDNLLPYFGRMPAVFTLYDLVHRFFPQTQTSLNRLYLTLMLPHFLRQARAIIAISENTRAEAIRLYRLQPGQIVSIPLGVNPRFRPGEPAAVAAVRAKYQLPAKFLLAVGTIEPRKNLTVLLHALAENSALSLVIAGRRGWLADGFFQRLDASGLSRRVALLGHTPDEDLPALYSAARAFVFPSLYEGFGLPVLEAMACGTPVVCSDTPSLLEVAGAAPANAAAPAAVMARPDDPPAFRQAIERLWDDDITWSAYRARGLAHASPFTWERTARRTLEVYEAI